MAFNYSSKNDWCLRLKLKEFLVNLFRYYVVSHSFFSTFAHFLFFFLPQASHFRGLYLVVAFFVRSIHTRIYYMLQKKEMNGIKGDYFISVFWYLLYSCATCSDTIRNQLKKICGKCEQNCLFPESNQCVLKCVCTEYQCVCVHYTVQCTYLLIDKIKVCAGKARVEKHWNLNKYKRHSDEISFVNKNWIELASAK